MSGPTVHVGAEKFTAVMSGEVYRSDGSIFQQAMPEVQSQLFAEDGFLARTIETQDRLSYWTQHITSANSGNMAQIYYLNDIEELPLVSGKMLHYCMSEPKLKQLYLDGEYETVGYNPTNEEIGAMDEYYQHIHDGEVLPTIDGYQTTQWLYENGNPLSAHEQFIMIRNHTTINKNIDNMVYDTDKLISKDGVEGELITMDKENFIKY